MSRKAFTLVELLVVISIIGLLSTIAVVSLGAARSKARNAKRIADIKQVVTAFNLGYNNGGSYPSTGGNVWACFSSSCYAGWSTYTSIQAVDDFLSPYIPTKVADPTDPYRGRGGFLYNGSWPGGPSGAGAYLNYAMEGSSLDCGPGKLWVTGSGYYECMLKLET